MIPNASAQLLLSNAARSFFHRTRQAPESPAITEDSASSSKSPTLGLGSGALNSSGSHRKRANRSSPFFSTIGTQKARKKMIDPAHPSTLGPERSQTQTHDGLLGALPRLEGISHQLMSPSNDSSDPETGYTCAWVCIPRAKQYTPKPHHSRETKRFRITREELLVRPKK